MGEIPRQRTQFPFRASDPLVPRHRPSHRLLGVPSCSCVTQGREEQRRGSPLYEGFTSRFHKGRGQWFVLRIRAARVRRTPHVTYGTRKENPIDRSKGTREQTKWSRSHHIHSIGEGGGRRGEGNDVLLPILPLLPPLCPLCGMWTQTPAMPPNDGRLPADVLAPCTPCASSSSSVFGEVWRC